MELPTRTLPHNYIAIIKIFAMSLCTVSFTAFHCFSLDKPQTLMSLQRKHFRGTVSGGLQSWTVPRNWGLETPPPPDALGWPWPAWSSAVPGEGGACKTCKSGALRQNILPGKRGGGRKMDLRLYIYSSIFNSFISKRKEKNNWLKKKKKQHLN